MEKPHNYFQPNCREQHGAGLACVETAPKEAFIDCVECPVDDCRSASDLCRSAYSTFLTYKQNSERPA
jgi:hypothetical protein